MTEDIQNHRQDLMARANNSPYYQLLGMKLVALDEDWARLTMPVETKLFQWRGITHGGAIASIADSAAAFAVIPSLRLDQVTSTVEIKVNYLRPISKGALTAEGRVVSKGRRVVVVELDVWQDDGKLVAKGMATMIIT